MRAAGPPLPLPLPLPERVYPETVLPAVVVVVVLLGGWRERRCWREALVG